MEESHLNTQSINNLSTTHQTKTLFQAAATGDIEALKWWVEVQHQPLNIKDNYHRTPLMWAALKGEVEVFNYLISQSKSSQQVEVMGAKEALSLAIFQGHWEIVKNLSKVLNWEG